MFELRLDSDFSLIGKFETKEGAIQVMNEKIDDVLIDDSILMFNVTKLVFSRNGKKTIDKVIITKDIKKSNGVKMLDKIMLGMFYAVGSSLIAIMSSAVVLFLINI
jgi:hypothetical protein